MIEAAAFGVEVALLATLAVDGTSIGDGRALHVGLAVALPLVGGVFWGLLMAPTSRHRLADPGRLIAQVVLFAATGALTVATGHVVWGIVFAVAAIAVFALTRR